ncbi:MAG: nicotinamide-nucleotide amidohydrolase family protein [Gammaproteobacteria bacterium]|nr:nicotinamide-nucleotide amidohydrolase family protein [Gammaproteobacteria bacterium]NIQ12046.1 nicotinamide-nucleotide amidohydrolase family protein [Gammaproteobacteria bacterium]NIR27700.1 nicotinamide-nucleotide amidohydrolase family protein [Gammaproteobacteria bacterium]NIY20344.1 nicotinamide-nucleotide amidohydrolase family protein [Gammaproteobacteria bacterium]
MIANGNGTAPGFFLQQDGTDLFFLPGVPNEMLAMLNQTVVTSLLEKFTELPPICRRNINVFGLPEPEVESRLKNVLPDDVSLAFNVDFPLVIIKLTARGATSQKLIDRAELAVRKHLEEYVIGIDDETLAQVTARHLTAAGLSLALAESCTGGLIAELLTDQAGASAFLERSVVTYANSAKTGCLNVPEIILEQHGAVSAECASAMARGAKATAQTDIALSVTGIAGPDGGTPEKPVGTVYISLFGDDVDRTEQFHFPGNRYQVRLRAASTALDWLRRYAISSLEIPQEH